MNEVELKAKNGFLIIFLSVLPMLIHALKQPNTRALLRKQLLILLTKTKRKK